MISKVQHNTLPTLPNNHLRTRILINLMYRHRRPLSTLPTLPNNHLQTRILINLMYRHLRPLSTLLHLCIPLILINNTPILLHLTNIILLLQISIKSIKIHPLIQIITLH